MKTLQDYIDKLNKLNFKEMYENDFFLTWEKTDDELEAVLDRSRRTALHAREQHLHKGIRERSGHLPYSAITPPVHVSPSLPPATC